GQQQGARAGAGGGQRGLGTGVAATDHDDVVAMEGLGHGVGRGGTVAILAPIRAADRAWKEAVAMRKARSGKIGPKVGTLPADNSIAPNVIGAQGATDRRSEEHTSELQSRENLVCRLLREKKKSGHRHTSSQ